MLEQIRGKETSFLSWAQLSKTLANYQVVHLDIGTGDGRFVQTMAQQNANTFVIGVDACRENLLKTSRNAPKNALFLIANAESLPEDLTGIINRLSINFPWGSLLDGLLEAESVVLQGLSRLLTKDANLEIRLNAGALAEAGYSLEAGVEQVWQAMTLSGFRLTKPKAMIADDLSAFPTTWAKRLAYGRDARAIYFSAKLKR